MQFNSLGYFLFFISVCIGYFILPCRFRWVLLLIASYLFYMCWKVEYAILLLIITGTTYVFVISNSKYPSMRIRKYLLASCLIVNLSLLFIFKYFNFISTSIQSIFNYFTISINTPIFHILLPIGISFYTFRTISYIIDVYRGTIAPEKNFGIFSLYVSFFPSLFGRAHRSSNQLDTTVLQAAAF